MARAESSSSRVSKASKTGGGVGKAPAMHRVAEPDLRATCVSTCTFVLVQVSEKKKDSRKASRGGQG